MAQRVWLLVLWVLAEVPRATAAPPAVFRELEPDPRYTCALASSEAEPGLEPCWAPVWVDSATGATVYECPWGMARPLASWLAPDQQVFLCVARSSGPLSTSYLIRRYRSPFEQRLVGPDARNYGGRFGATTLRSELQLLPSLSTKTGEQLLPVEYARLLDGDVYQAPPGDPNFPTPDQDKQTAAVADRLRSDALEMLTQALDRFAAAHCLYELDRRATSGLGDPDVTHPFRVRLPVQVRKRMAPYMPAEQNWRQAPLLERRIINALLLPYLLDHMRPYQEVEATGWLPVDYCRGEFVAGRSRPSCYLEGGPDPVAGGAEGRVVSLLVAIRETGCWRREVVLSRDMEVLWSTGREVLKTDLAKRHEFRAWQAICVAETLGACVQGPPSQGAPKPFFERAQLHYLSDPRPPGGPLAGPAVNWNKTGPDGSPLGVELAGQTAASLKQLGQRLVRGWIDEGPDTIFILGNGRCAYSRRGAQVVLTSTQAPWDLRRPAPLPER